MQDIRGAKAVRRGEPVTAQGSPYSVQKEQGEEDAKDPETT